MSCQSVAANVLAIVLFVTLTASSALAGPPAGPPVWKAGPMLACAPFVPMVEPALGGPQLSSDAGPRFELPQPVPEPRMAGMPLFPLVSVVSMATCTPTTTSTTTNVCTTTTSTVGVNPTTCTSSTSCTKIKGKNTCITTWTCIKCTRKKTCTVCSDELKTTTVNASCSSSTTTMLLTTTSVTTCVPFMTCTTSVTTDTVVTYDPVAAPPILLPPPTLPPMTLAPPQPANEDLPSNAAGDVYLLIRTPVVNNAWVYKFNRPPEPPAVPPPLPAYFFPQECLFAGNPADAFGLSADRNNYVYTLHQTYVDPSPRDVTANLLNLGTYGDRVLQIDPAGNETYITVKPGAQQAQPGYAYLPPPCNIVHPSFQACKSTKIITENKGIYPNDYHGGIMGQGGVAGVNDAARNIANGLIWPTVPSVDRNFTFDLKQDDGKLEPTKPSAETHSVRVYLNCLVPVLSNVSTVVNKPPFYLSADNQDNNPDILPHPSMINPSTPLTDASGLWYSTNTSRHWVTHFAAKRYTGGFTIQKTSYGAQRYSQGATQTQAQIGPNLSASVNLAYKYYKRSSCGEGCLNGPATNTGGITHALPSRMFFSSLGGSGGLNGLAYTITNNSIVKRDLDLAGNWILPVQDTTHWFELLRPGYTSGPNITCLGVGDRDATGAWVYYTKGVPQNYFAVASSFFRDGGLVFSYDAAGNQINWDQYLGNSKQVGGTVQMPPKVSGRQVEAITADGLGNLGVMCSTFQPPGLPANFAGNNNPEMLPDFDTLVPPINEGQPDLPPYSSPASAVVTVGPPYLEADDTMHRDVILQQKLKFDFAHMKLDVLHNGAVTWTPGVNTVDRGTLEMPPLRWQRKQVLDSSDGDGDLSNDPWKWEGPAFYDPRDTALDYSGSYRVELASVDITEPPLIAGSTNLDVKSTGAVGGFGKTAADAELVDEDTTKTFELENPPVFNWLTAGPMGAQNASYMGVDQDGDGSGGSLISSIVNPWTSDLSGLAAATGLDKSVKWTWTITNETLKGQPGYPGPTVVNGNHVTNGNASAGTVDTKTNYKFQDPGLYKIVLDLGFLQWNIPQGVDSNSTVNDLSFTRQNLQVVHWVRVQATKNPDSYVKSITVGGPDKQIFEDVPTAANQALTVAEVPSGTIGNWYTSADVYFYRGVQYDYYKGQGQGADINADTLKQGKYNGVGKWDWSHPSKPGLPVNGGIPDPKDVLNDGLPKTPGDPTTAEGTMSDDSRYSAANLVDSAEAEYDWHEIKYYWFLRYRNPDTGQYVLTGTAHAAAPTNDGNSGRSYHRIREGNLAEIWALERARKAGSFTYAASILANGKTTFITLPTAGLLPTDPNRRRYSVNIPLIQPTLLSTANPFGDENATLTAAARNTATFPAGSVARLAFQVPCEPSALELVCRIKYPRVRWDLLNNAGAPGNLYFTLVDDGTDFGTYVAAAGDPDPTQPKVGTDVGKATVDGTEGDFIDFTVLDKTRPELVASLAFGGGQFTGEFFDGSGQTLTMRDNNPYQHWTQELYATPPTFTDDQLARPRVVFFAYETGANQRDCINGLQLSAGCLGFDLVGPTANPDKLSGTTADDNPFESGVGRQGTTWGKTGPFENGTSASYPVTVGYGTRNAGGRAVGSSFLTFGVASPVTASNGISFDTATAKSDCPPPSPTLAATDILTWFNSANTLKRETVWKLPAGQSPLPLFSLDGAAPASVGPPNNKLLAFARGREYLPRNTDWGQGSLDENGNDDATYVGAILMADNDAPHLRVTLTDSRSGIPKVYAVYPEHRRGGAISGANPPVRVHISNDNARPIYGATKLNIARAGYDNFASGNQLTAPTQLVQVELQKPFSPGITPAIVLDTQAGYYVEESTIITLLIEATDNINNEDVDITVQSSAAADAPVGAVGLPVSAVLSAEAWPTSQASDAIKNTSLKKAIVRLTHRYAKGGVYDVITITARDKAVSGANQAVVKIPIFVVPYNASFRQIGVTK